MGSRWRGLLAPINTPTGDGRRMAPGAFTNRPLPLPLKWQRTDENGHTTSVVVGSMDKLDIDEAGESVWGEGELFDDASPITTPRLAEDVAEAKLLLGKKVIGPSVDPGSAQAVTVMKGSNEPLNDTMLERYWMQHGEMPETELLFTNYEIAAATLVPVPAFALCRPFELLDASGEPMPDAMRSIMAAAPMAALDPALFRNPELTTYTPVTMVDLGNGWTHVFGHVAAHSVCHVGKRGACTTAPYSDQDYQPFHRYSVTSGGHELPVMAGRLTSGLGRFENLCRCHPGNDDHACGNVSFGAAIAHHDQMESLAYVCAGEDERNDAIWFSGVLDPECSEQARRLLNRRRVSGDWREYGASMELVEVLVLARREPGFPPPRVSVENGRQRSLTAAGVIMPERPVRDEFNNSTSNGWGETEVGGIDYDRLGSIVAQNLMNAAAASMADDEELCPEGDDELCGDLLDGDLAFDRGQRRDAKGRWSKGGGARGVSGIDAPGEGAGGGGSPGATPGVPARERTAAEAVDEWADQMRAEHPDLKLDIAQKGSGHVVLSRIVLPKGDRGKGTGSKIMQSLTDLADELGVTLALTPSADFGGSVARLKRFYESFGFVPNKGRNRDFEVSESYIRPPARGAITAAVRSDWSGLPLAPDGREWDKGAAVRRLVDWADDDISGKYAQAFIWRDPDGDPDLQGTYKLPVADIIDGRLTIVPNAVRNVASRLEQTQGLAPDDVKRVRSVLDKLFDRIHEQAGTMAADDDCGKGQHRMPDGSCMDDSAMTAAGPHTGAMVALRMTDADAARLAVEGGLAPDEMHMTLAYLGEAADISQDARDRMVKSMTRIANKVGAPIEAEGFSVSAFNPGDANDRETAIVMGVSGSMLADMQKGVCKALGNCDGYEMPGQHEPWNAHTTLEYSDDLSKVAEYADRVGPITFDRLRLAFAGDIIDIPLGEIIKADEVEQDERDSDDQMYARMARANQLAAQLWFANQQATGDHIAMLTEKIQATAPALAE